MGGKRRRVLTADWQGRPNAGQRRHRGQKEPPPASLFYLSLITHRKFYPQWIVVGQAPRQLCLRQIQ